MTLITLDFETYFDNDYTLKKLTTENYVRDPRFEALCVGIKFDNKPANSMTPLLDSPFYSGPIVTGGVLCHHAHFDGLILSHHYNIKPRFWFDTLSMARCAFPHEKSHSLENLAKKFDLGHKTVPYQLFKGKRGSELSDELYDALQDGCAHDVELTYQLFKKLLPLVPKEELKIIDLTIRMFTEPMLQLDQDRAKKYMQELIKKQDKLLNDLSVTKEDLRSADKFAGLLESLGVEPPTKYSPKQKKETYAFAKTDPGFISLLEHEDEQISLLCSARLSSKSTIGETRASRLISMSERGNLSVYLKYFGAHTGRWSGGDKLNFQNLQRGGELRRSIMAPEGFVLCVADLSQVECRMLNWLAGETRVLDAFRDGRDIYCEMAGDLYAGTITKADTTERFVGKTIELGAGFGVGWKKVQRILKLNKVVLDDNEAKHAVQTYRQTHPQVAKLWRQADLILKNMLKSTEEAPFIFNWGPMIVRHRSIVLPNGIVLDYSNLDVEAEDIVLRNPKGTTKIWWGLLVENVVQALARIIMSQAMLKISSIYRIVLTTHDEVVYLAPEAEGKMGLETGINLLRAEPDWCRGLPLDAEGGYAREYSK